MNDNPLVPAPIARLPWKLLLLVIAIGGFGTVILYSAAGGNLRPWALPHALRFTAFLFAAIALSYIGIQRLKQMTMPIYAILLVLLLAVEIMGVVGGGAQRWLNLGFIHLQPSELMKPAVVLMVARFFDILPSGEIRGWHALWPPLALIGLPVVLVLLQPDLGTALTILGGGITVMFLAGLPLRLFVGSGLALGAALPIVVSLLHDYQRKRVEIFLDPEKDPLGAGYHIIQSKIAIGSGGLTGKGFLQGTQSHLDYLPEGHTDFVFATMAEEWGLAGSVFLILAYLLVVNWGMRVALSARSRYGRLAAAGLSTTIFFYFAINLMMVMGLAPVVGIPLPLVSYGGSAMMTVMICLGLLMAIARSERASSQSAF